MPTSLNTSLKIKRDYKIRNKIISKENLKTICDAIYTEYSISKDSQNYSSFNIQIDCNDNSNYDDSTLSILNDGNILDIKKINQLSITFYNYSHDKRINLTLSDTDEYLNYFTISGSNNNWVEGTYTKLLNIINSFTPQENFVLTHKKLINNVSSIIFGLPIYRLYTYVLNCVITPKPLENPSQALLLLKDILNTHIGIAIYTLLMSWCMGGLPSIYFTNKLYKLWTSIEFDFGPEHNKYLKNKRKKIWLFITIIIIPILINIFWSFIS